VPSGGLKVFGPLSGALAKYRCYKTPSLRGETAGLPQQPLPRGRNPRVALEFYAPGGLTRLASSAKHFRASRGYAYDVEPEIVFISNDICVLDFGLAAYSENSSILKASCRLGDVVRGKISLGLDPQAEIDPSLRRKVWSNECLLRVQDPKVGMRN
jgi:hypothetical protein